MKDPSQRRHIFAEPEARHAGGVQAHALRATMYLVTFVYCVYCDTAEMQRVSSSSSKTHCEGGLLGRVQQWL